MPEVIVLTETWLPNDYATTYNIDDHYLLNKGRKPDERGGGILVFSSKKYEIERLPSMEMPNQTAENILFGITNTVSRFRFPAIYKPSKNGKLDKGIVEDPLPPFTKES